MMKHKCSYTYSWRVITNMLIVGATETHFKLKKIFTIESNLAKELIISEVSTKACCANRAHVHLRVLNLSEDTNESK